MRNGSFGLICAFLLTGCAHQLPKNDAIAFQTLATANRDSFQALAQSESDSVTTFVSRRLEEGVGAISYKNCDKTPVEGGSLPCTAVWTPKIGKPIELRPTAAKTRALIGGLAGYGEQMATLAKAEDVTELQSSADGVATSIKALGTALGMGPLANVIIDAAAWIGKRRMIEKRRSALLEAAREADPSVQLAARRLGEISTLLRGNLTDTAHSRITDAHLAIGANKAASSRAAAKSDAGGELAPRAPVSTAEALTELVQATQDLEAARDLSTDYSALGVAHDKLVKALANPKQSTAHVLADVKTFLTLLKAAETATKGK